MKVTAAIWELENLGKHTVEWVLGDQDSVTSADLASVVGCEHVVVKVPAARIDQIHFLEEKGFRFVEAQCSLSRETAAPFPKPAVVESIARLASRRKIGSLAELQPVLQRIKANLFSTDRISLDPQFGPQLAANRYCRWMSQVITQPQALVFEIQRREKGVGFFYAELHSAETLKVILGGIYPEYQASGLGLLLIQQPLALARELSATRIETEISSNNLPVLRLYEALGYHVSGLHYVLRRILG